MKSQVVHLLCGVPGSGKTFLAKQVADKFCYVPHDEYIGKPQETYATVLAEIAIRSDRPVLGEAPFRMSLVMRDLQDAGITVHAYFIKEPEELIKQRYEAREKKPIPKQHLTNYRRLLFEDRAWKVGSQKEILDILQRV